MYRKFYLQNSKGDTFKLTDENFKQFLSNPSGLGFKRTVTGYVVGNAMKINAASYDFTQIDGSILFYNKREQAYQDYFNFVNFTSFTPIKLFYTPANTLSSYFCEVEILKADKTEYNVNGYLEVPVQFQATSHWQDAVESIIEASNQNIGDGKQYPLERPYYYASSTLSDIKIINDGSDAVGFKIEVIGNVTNPQWSIYQNGELYGTCKINGTYDYVSVVSIDGQNNIYLELNGSAITNPASYQDLSITGGDLTFIKLKTGESHMTFTAGNISTFTGNVKIHLRNSYVSV